jgi:hypothetical protein
MIILRMVPLLLLLALVGCAGAIENKPDASSWTWEVVRSGVPNFEGKNNRDFVVVGVRFHNRLTLDRPLVVKVSDFSAGTTESEPVEIFGLLFQGRGGSGAKSMSGVGNSENTEMLFDVRGEARYPFIRSQGPVEVVVGGQGSYVQGLVLVRRPGQTVARLSFGGLPELEIELPDVAPTP